MKTEKLLDAIGKIDDELIACAAEYDAIQKDMSVYSSDELPAGKNPHKRSRFCRAITPSKHSRLFQGITAACICLIAIGALRKFFFMTPSDSDLGITPDDSGFMSQIAMSNAPDPDPSNSNYTESADTANNHIPNNPGNMASIDTPNNPGNDGVGSTSANDILHPWTGPTSDTYQNLDELLAYLSLNDYHNSREDSLKSRAAEINADGLATVEGAAVVTYANYAYHIGGNKVNISRLGNGNPENAGMIDFAAEKIFISGNQLVLVGRYEDASENIALEEYNICVRLYDLSNPESPLLRQEFLQLGQLCACYMLDGTLYLLTSDGVCACGYSRLDDTSKYKPQLSQNGEPIAWEESEICILDEPSRVQYLAATRIDINDGKIDGKLAFYGDIENIFYGPHWLALVTQNQADSMEAPENVYTFSTPSGLLRFSYTGKIDLASLPEASNYMYPHICSITKSGNTYRMMVECTSSEKDSTSGSQTLPAARLIVAAVNILQNKTDYAVLDYYRDNSSTLDKLLCFDELLWEGDRAIISVSSTKWIGGSPVFENRFIFAEFSDTGIRLYDNELIADHVAGIEDVFWYSSPFGNLDSFIPMGNGIYLRYNETPDGLDIYDFSDVSNPQCLYKSAGDIPKTCRFDFTWEVYAEDTFGIMTITPDENGDFRHAAFSWNIFSLNENMDNPYTLLARYDLGEGSAFRSMGFATFEYDGQFYYITRDSDTAVALDWQMK